MASIASLLYIAGGGALGTLARVGVNRAVIMMGSGAFPYGTLLVNSLGSLVAGWLFVSCAVRWPRTPLLYGFGIGGFLGAFTTFSAFSIDTLTLLQSGSYSKALLNVGLNVILSLGCCALGMHLAR